jgi:DNA polymerase/3'-5' exonuclease PolX
MPLTTARSYASQIVTWLSPHCTRIEIAGSIRRQRPVCNDVDIVCIPKTVEHRDLLGQLAATDNLLHQFLVDYVKERNPLNSPGRTPRWASGGDAPGKQAIIELLKCQLDLWFADEKTFAIRLLMRTGSKEHNIWIADRATDRGYHFKPYEGLVPEGHARPLQFDTESAIYNHLGLAFIEPQNREEAWLRKNIDSGLTV